MPLLSALLSFLSRQLSTLLRAVFGWSISALFGRLPTSKQTALSGALVLSLAWPLLVIGVFVPSVASWALAFLPLEKWLGAGVLRIVWLVLAIAVPLLVGAITRWVAPPRQTKGGLVRTLASGYAITVGFFVAFLLTLAVVPFLKLGAMWRGWSDEHVYLLAREGQYGRVLETLAASRRAVGKPVTVKPLPKVMALPTRVLQVFAGAAVQPIVAEEPKMLERDDLRVYLYPADLLLRGKKPVAARVRAEMVRQPLGRFAHLVEDPAGQEIEDELERLWTVVERHRAAGWGDHVGDAIRDRVRALASELDRADLGFDQWLLLYTDLHRIERTLDGGPTLVDPPVEELDHTTSLTRREAPMDPHDPYDLHPPHDASLRQLVSSVLGESRELARVEIALAKDELRAELRAARTAGIGVGVALVLAIAGIALLLVAIAMAFGVGWLAPLIVGVITLAVAAGAGWYGWHALPHQPLGETRKRARTDLHMLQEHMA